MVFSNTVVLQIGVTSLLAPSGGCRLQKFLVRCHAAMLLVDEPSITRPRFIDMVFEILDDLRKDGKIIIMVEQNAKRLASLQAMFCSGETAIADEVTDC